MTEYHAWFWPECLLFAFEGGSCICVQTSLIRPRKIGLPSARPILLRRSSVRCLDKGLVRRSANWSWVCTCWTWRLPFCTKSHTKWRSIWMCFMREWLTGLKLRCVAPRLSQRSWGGAETGKASSLSKVASHRVSEAALARALYSASVLDRATTRCFLELQDMGLEPKKLM